jgi:predicted transcriptional regulator
MITLPTPKDFEIEAAHAGISLVDACKIAKVTPAIWHRWKRGKSTPNLATLAKLAKTLDDARCRAEVV